MAGRLILCGTPIGNLGDASPRLREALAEAEVVFAEDTRRSRRLLKSLEVERSLRSYFVGNEAVRAAELAGLLRGGATVALLTDAGMPGVSDPGLSAVRAARETGATVTVIPGPSAVTAALAVSGLPSERWVFEGFLPRAGKERNRRLAELAVEARTMVLFCAPRRALQDLTDLAAKIGSGRPVAVARELTKVFEEVWYGTLGEAVEHTKPRGELTLVIGGAPSSQPQSDQALAEVATLTEAGVSLSEAVRRVAEESGIGRRSLYQQAIRLRRRD